MMRLLMVALALTAPLPALALSCLAPSVEATFERVQASPDTFVVVHGRLFVDKNKMPRSHPVDQSPPQMTFVPAKIMGRALSRSGFNEPFEREITLEVACFGPWCGSAASGVDVLAFIKRDEGQYALAIDPCGGDVFVTPHTGILNTVKSCFSRGQC